MFSILKPVKNDMQFISISILQFICLSKHLEQSKLKTHAGEILCKGKRPRHADPTKTKRITDILIFVYIYVL